MTPAELGYCLKGHRLKKKMRDEEMWLWFGNYALSAVGVAVDYNLRGDKAKSEYIKKPILQEEKKESEYKESNEEIAIFEMKQRINALRKKGLPESPE